MAHISASTVLSRRHNSAMLPMLLLAVAVAGAAVLLALPLTLPIGPMYWDLGIYFDGAHRVLSGQVPAVDFFAPVGPLGYWLFALLLPIFENAQPLLLVQWSLLLITAPPMFIVLWQVGRASPAVALALLIPFLFFQLLPMNVEQYSTYPSVDGYGIYNRQVSEILYVLTAALVFVRGQRALLAIIVWTCLALFLLKITGFVAAGLICAFAFAAGRVSLRTTVAILATFLLALLALQVTTGVVSAYLFDILALVRLNEGALLPRFLQAGSIHFGILAPAGLLTATLVVLNLKALGSALADWRRRPSFAGVSALLDREVFWLAMVLFAGLFFETQNTGGQALIFVWPVLLWILLGAHCLAGASLVLVLTLVAATALPPVVNVAHRAARAAIGQLGYVDVPSRHLKTLGQVTQRPEIVARATQMWQAYVGFPEAYRFLVDLDELPALTLYSDLDFQAGWLMSVDEAVGAILDYEAANGVRFETIMSLNFANPFPYLLDREATRHVAIGADPYRAVPSPDSETLAAVAATDLILYPNCPLTSANEALRRFYEPAMTSHVAVELSPCWRGYLRQGLAPNEG